MSAEEITPVLRTGQGEREDLIVPLPESWTVADLKNVVLYQNSAISPPCCKIRQVLSYYKVPFSIINGGKPNSEYKKFPVLDIQDKQVR